MDILFRKCPPNSLIKIRMNLNYKKENMITVRFAIIGCGLIAHKHAAAIKKTPQAKLVACYSATRSNAERFAFEFGIEAFNSYEELLASPIIDAVSLCTPSGLHTPQALLAIQANKHVLIEKPMSLSLAEADSLINAQKEFDRKVGVVFQFRFAPAVQEIKRAIEQGAFGKIVSASLQMKYYRSAEYYKSAAWRGTWEMDGGGALMNQGVHGIDVLRYLMGPVRKLTAYTRTLTHDIEVEDSAVAILEFEDGALGTIEGSTACFPGYSRRLEICGDQGSLVMEEDSIIKWDLPIACSLSVGKAAENMGSSDPTAISLDGHILQYINFNRAVLFNEPLLADVNIGRQSLEIILAIYASSQSSKTISMKGF